MRSLALSFASVYLRECVRVHTPVTERVFVSVCVCDCVRWLVGYRWLNKTARQTDIRQTGGRAGGRAGGWAGGCAGRHI